MRNLNILSKILVATFYLLTFSFNSFSQSVGINDSGAAPDNSALLDLNSTNKGFLITRADTANISTPAFGLMTLAPVDSCLYIYNGVNWKGMGGGGSNCNCNCGTPIEGGTPAKCGMPFIDKRDNKSYETVELGNQCWMSENLNYTPSSGNSWCYNNDVNQCNTYGRLYDWNTTTNTTSSIANPSGVQGVCPAGWHIPSDAEWQELEVELGMTPAVASTRFWRGTDQGSQLKAVSPAWNGTNSSGFTALPGGYRLGPGWFNFMNHYGDWWTATENGSDAWMRTLWGSQNDVHRNYYTKDFGFSVRCVRD